MAIWIDSPPKKTLAFFGLLSWRSAVWAPCGSDQNTISTMGKHTIRVHPSLSLEVLQWWNLGRQVECVYAHCALLPYLDHFHDMFQLRAIWRDLEDKQQYPGWIEVLLAPGKQPFAINFHQLYLQKPPQFAFKKCYIIWVVVSISLYVYPYPWGDDPILTSICSTELKPPTSIFESLVSKKKCAYFPYQNFPIGKHVCVCFFPQASCLRFFLFVFSTAGV